MLQRSELGRLARSRVQDATILHRARRFDAAYYLCGYAVEFALKSRICQTLRWAGFPESGKEFTGLASFKVHDLELLLRLTGIEDRVKQQRMTEWSVVARWQVDSRYNPIGRVSEADSKLMIDSARSMLKTVLPR